MLGHSALGELAIGETPGDFKCHCGEWRFKNAFFVVDETREQVCRDLPMYREIEGKQYCVLHFPDKAKSDDFQKVLDERLSEETWNFKMVYFPTQFVLDEKELVKDADFAHASFSAGASFRNCKFRGRFEFFDCIFSEDVSFAYSDFFGSVNFNSTDFEDTAHFYGVTFHPGSTPTFKSANFKSALFSQSKFLKQDFKTNVGFERSRFHEQADFSGADFYYDADFQKTQFPTEGKIDFEGTTFHKSVCFDYVDFSNAIFSRATFCKENELFARTSFSNCRFVKSVTFQGAVFNQRTDFDKSWFDNAHFEESEFRGTASFREAKFDEDVFFNNAKFGHREGGTVSSVNVHFEGTEFRSNSRVFFENTWFSHETKFDYAKFDGFLFFKGRAGNLVFDDLFEAEAWGRLLSFDNTTFSSPEKVYFQTVRLRPAWFVNSVFDVRKVNFIDIYWGSENSTVSIDEELKIVQKRYRYNTKKLLGVAFRQLADNAETNNRFDWASDFRRLAFETELRVRKAKQAKWFHSEMSCKEAVFSFLDHVGRSPFDLAFFLYRVTSSYGESSLKAFNWLTLFIVVALFLYMSPLVDFSTDQGHQSLGFVESLSYSLRVMVLQRPEPQPVNAFGKLVLAIESIVAPAQLTLLALALRRKFIR